MGNYAAYDHGGGLFHWDASSTADAIPGMIEQVSGVATGRWIRQIEGTTLNALWFGCRARNDADGVSPYSSFDNFNYIKAALDYMEANPQYKELYFPAGEYYTARTLSYYSSKTINVTIPIHIKGDPGLNVNIATTFIFPSGVCGFRFLYGNPGDYVKYSGKFYKALTYSLNVAPSGTTSDTDEWEYINDTGSGIGLWYDWSSTVEFYGNSTYIFYAGADEVQMSDIVIKCIASAQYQGDMETTEYFIANGTPAINIIPPVAYTSPLG